MHAEVFIGSGLIFAIYFKMYEKNKMDVCIDRFIDRYVKK